MTIAALLARNLQYHWRSHIAVLLGVIAGTGTLTGALLVGDSMRGSLRAAALERLGQVASAVQAPRYFPASLRDRLAEAYPIAENRLLAPLITLAGGIESPRTGARAAQIGVLGVDEAFWQLDTGGTLFTEAGRAVALNRRLSEELGATVGDDVLLRLGKPAAVSTESLLGRRDETTTTLRLTVRSILPNEGLASFSFAARQAQPLNALVPLATLQRALGQEQRVNALLVGTIGAEPMDPTAQTTQLLRRAVRCADLGLRIRADAARGYLSLESESMQLDPPVLDAANAAARELGWRTTRLMTYLANTLAVADGPASAPRGTPATSPRPVPYSTISALVPDEPTWRAISTETGLTLQPGEIVLNEWAADRLGARVGQSIRVSYYVTGPFGRLDERYTSFALAGIVPLAGAAADPGFTPEYPGITDTQRVSDWDPPFPVDLARVTPDDEAYWDRHRATPKAFIALEQARALWKEPHESEGRLTALRFHPPTGSADAAAAAALDTAFCQHIDPAALGLRAAPLRAAALAASSGSTDFSGLFVGFSFFLIASAAMLVALLFRLSVERRASEIGLLLATGLPRARVARLLTAEGALLALPAALLGLVGAAGYAGVMIAGLRGWWSDAVSAPFLRLHVQGTSLAVGYLLSVAIALVALRWSLRGLTALPPRAVLAGLLPAAAARAERRPHRALGGAAVAGAAALLLITLAMREQVAPAGGFFGGGALLLVAGLAVARDRLGRPPSAVIHAPGAASIARLGLRNAPRYPGRSLLTIGLLASATFLVAALGVFRLDGADDPTDRRSGTGGFALRAEATAPLPFDLNTSAGRDALGIAPAAEAELARTRTYSFRLRAGDQTSCLNLYRPTQPRVLGVTNAFSERGGFRFAASEAQTPEERANPWRLLRTPRTDGAIPVIGDEAAVRWQLKRGLGQELVIQDEAGRDVRLRFVALLSGSILQGELLIAEPAFLELFPSVDGYAFFLIEAPAAVTAGTGDERPASPSNTPTPRALSPAAYEQSLERELAPFGFDARATPVVLRELFAVQNTYISTFQTLGGLGLVLGTFGLIAVMLRNVWERRRELALLQAVGYSRGRIGLLVLAENLALVLSGLVIGLIAALVAVAPQLAARPAAVPWASLTATLVGVLVVGLLAGLFALRAALRAPLIPALRSE